jgi:hypothetical protein
MLSAIIHSIIQQLRNQVFLILNLAGLYKEDALLVGLLKRIIIRVEKLTAASENDLT